SQSSSPTVGVGNGPRGPCQIEHLLRRGQAPSNRGRTRRGAEERPNCGLALLVGVSPCERVEQHPEKRKPEQRCRVGVQFVRAARTVPRRWAAKTAWVGSAPRV